MFEQQENSGAQQQEQNNAQPEMQPGASMAQLPSEREGDFATSLRNAMQDHLTPPANTDGPLPAGLVANAASQAIQDEQVQAKENNHENQTVQSPQDQSNQEINQTLEGEQKNDQSTENQEERKPEQQQENDEITAIKLEKFGREYSISEIEAAIEGFNYYHPKAMKLQEDIQRFSQEKQEFAQLKNSPEFQLTEMLKKDPNLKSRVLETVRGYDSEAAGQIQTNEAQQKMQNEIEQLKQELQRTKENERQKALRERQKQLYIQQQQRQQEIISTSQELDNAVTQKLEGLKAQGVELTDQDLNLIAESATAQIKAGKMQYHKDQLIPYFNKMIDHLSSRVANARQQGIGNYQAHKRNLPPAPPSGGAAPVVGPEAPGPGKFEETFANRLEMVLGKL